jgi:predicted aspartyl protease
MPAVFASSVLICGKRKVRAKVLLNTGGIDAELVIPKKLANRLGLKATGKAQISFGGRSYLADSGPVEVIVEGGKEKRRATLDSIVLPDEVLGRPLFGVTGLEKLRVIPDVIAGKIIFR